MNFLHALTCDVIYSSQQISLPNGFSQRHAVAKQAGVVGTAIGMSHNLRTAYGGVGRRRAGVEHPKFMKETVDDITA